MTLNDVLSTKVSVRQFAVSTVDARYSDAIGHLFRTRHIQRFSCPRCSMTFYIIIDLPDPPRL